MDPDKLRRRRSSRDFIHRCSNSWSHASEHHTRYDGIEFIFPYLTPYELAAASSTCKPLNLVSISISAVRSSDAARGLEPFPIPFINSIGSHPYNYFLYSLTQIRITAPTRQFWGIGPTCRVWTSVLGLGDGKGCPCEGDNCGVECPCGGQECGTVCQCGMECGNRVSQGGLGARVRVVKDGKKGWCLVTAKGIPREQFVCEYAGELLTTEEARRQQIYDQLTLGAQFASARLVIREHLPSGNACMHINIDASVIGNVARFINHSCNGGKLSTVLLRSSGALLPRLYFFASKDIQENEELTFSYGEARNRSKGLQWFCGSSCCFGRLLSENT